MMLSTLLKRQLVNCWLGLIVSLIFSGCATSSLTSGLGGKPLVEHQLEYRQQFSWAASGSLSKITPSVQLGYGFLPQLSGYLFTDGQTIHLTGQYCFYRDNSSSSNSGAIAALGTVLYLGNQFSYAAGFAATYESQPFEWFGGYRLAIINFNRTSVDPTSFSVSPPPTFLLHVVHVGVRYWWNEKLNFHMEVAFPFQSTYLPSETFRMATLAAALIF